jgi:serine/threonine-protein kinase RIO1
LITHQHVNTLKQGDIFRDWLVDILGDHIHNKNCEVKVYKIWPSSHTVCRYKFRGENYGVVAKFFSEPLGEERHYDTFKAMEKEFRNLQMAGRFINVPKPIAIRKEFNCVLVTEYLRGKSLDACFETEDDLSERLGAIAQMLKRLHTNTRSAYRKDKEFVRFHGILYRLHLDEPMRETFNRLLGDWWYSPNLEIEHGCMIHNDVNIGNYIFYDNKPYALDLESAREHSHPAHDLGIMAAEIKKYFVNQEHSAEKADRYIYYFLHRYSEDQEDLERIIQALPFFMGMGFLRMARLQFNQVHQDYLLKEALNCLERISKH